MCTFNGKKLEINNKTYSIYKKITTNIVDSFVSASNKIGSGSGEARLYVSSASEDPIFKFDSAHPIFNKSGTRYPGCPYKCFFLKDNLLKYMEDLELEYRFPIESYRKDISNLYEDRINKINNKNDIIYFEIYAQDGYEDSQRSYIGSISPAWDLLREIALPKITNLNIYKIINTLDNNDILFYFELTSTDNSKSNFDISMKKKFEITESTIKNDTNINTTEKEALVKARNGQGKFRNNVLSIMSTCPFTGINTPSLLRASHILPWAECKNNNQRLDGYNGLALTPTYDLLFDLLLISFENDGRLIISKNLKKDIADKLNLTEGKVYDIFNSTGNRDEYLEYHRQNLKK